MEHSQSTGIDAWIVDLDSAPKVLRAELQAPADTPFEGGTFELSVDCSFGFPFSAPKVRFETLCYHPYVNPENGEIALVRLVVD